MSKQSAILLVFVTVEILMYATVACATDINDDLPGSVTWTTGGNPYILNPNGNISNPGAITLLSGTLTIEPGVVVKFNDNYGDFSLIINGGATLTAAGTSNSPITFTSSTGTGADDWGSIKFMGAAGAGNRATGTFDNCIIQYGGDIEESQSTNISGPIVLYEYADVTVTDCEIGDSYGSGIGVDYSTIAGFNTLDAIGNLIYNCQNGILISDHGVTIQQTIANNTIIGMVSRADNGNDGNGIYIDFGVDVTDFAVTNNTIINCDGHGIYSTHFDYLVNNTVAHVRKAGFYLLTNAGNDPTVENNIIYDYDDDASGGDEYGIYSDAAITVDYNYVYGRGGTREGSNVTFNGNGIQNNSDPGFAIDNSSVNDPTDSYNYHLLWNSVCLHEGNNNDVGNNLNGTTTDMGAFGGGDCATGDYYVAVGGTLPDGGSIHVIDDSPYRVVSDLTVPNGYDFAITNALDRTSSIVLEFMPGTELNVIGDLEVDGGSANSNSWIEFKPYIQAQKWDGIVFTPYLFDFLPSGDFVAAKIYYSDDDGIVLYSGVDLSLDCVTIEHCDGYAVDNSGGSLDMANCTIRYNNTGGIRYLNTSDGQVKGSTIAENGGIGIYLYNSTPSFRENTVAENGKNGIYCGSGSDVTLGVEGSYLGTRFQENGEDADNQKERAEIRIDASTPYFKNCHNDFVCSAYADRPYLLYDNGTIPSYNGKGNYWIGYSPNSPDWFYPADCVDLTDADASANRTAYTTEYFQLASQAEYAGNYASASELYLASLADNPHPAALRGWIRCESYLDTDESDLIVDLEDYLDDIDLGSAAFWARIVLQNQIADYESSIEQFDDMIEDAETELDSLRGLIGQLTTYYQMALSSGGGGYGTNSAGSQEYAAFGLPKLGVNEEIIPLNEADFEQKWAALHESMNHTSKLDGTTLPTEFSLHQNFPNPFNPTTTLSFDLVRPETVKLSVYNIMGQEVAKLVDRPMQAGTHSVTFDASQLASGMYFYRIEAGAFTDMKRMVLVK